MLAAFFNYENTLEVREAMTPRPKPGEALIKVETALICQRDLLILSGGFPTRPPIILGHEISGRVTEFGSPIPSSRAKVGDLVAIDPQQPCGLCKYCLTGREHLCTAQRCYGSFFNGGFAQYICVAENSLYPVDEKVLSAKEAAAAEPLACCIHAVRRAQVTPGDTALIMGCNAAGMIFIKLLRQAGVTKIIVCEENERRRDAALYYGADVVAGPEDYKNIVTRQTDGMGPDIIINCDGEPHSLEIAYSLAARGGRIVLYGMIPPGKKVSVDPNKLLANEITVTSAFTHQHTFYRAMEALPSLKLGELVTHTFRLEKINEALDTARRGIGFKIAITPNAEELPTGMTRVRRRSVTLRIPKPHEVESAKEGPTA